ncbi:MAG: DNA/RNA nuclease SfsA [Candidatus Adiutrix sp.]|jgi:sugar fermentation stimulation protein A|nr:DNA/RNA nuclease SfsA [Candidatus Adiutrix sp.]
MTAERKSGLKSPDEYLAERPDGSLGWGPLTEGILLRRYKRFLADVELPGGRLVTAHTPNTGRMLGCSEPGRPVWLSRHDRPGRKYPFSLEMISMPEALVGVNTAVPTRLAAFCARRGRSEELPRPAAVETEVRSGRSRLDMKITPTRGPRIFVEIKNCTLAENGTAFFPDAVTARGLKHLQELAALAAGGARAAIFILAQRGDARRFAPADHIDPAWGQALRRVVGAGVELLVYQAELTLESIRLGRRLPAVLY